MVANSPNTTPPNAKLSEMPTDNESQLLEGLVIDNPELEQLEELLDQFNIFEAIGAVRQELRHSDFLAFLLNPRQNHGLGDVFVKRLLQRALAQAPREALSITPVDFDIWSLDELTVQREWQNIDILLTDEPHQLSVIVENKIDSGEHSDQLERYWKIVQQQYPNHHLIGIYLTPDREGPSDERYLPLDYGAVSGLIEKLVDTRRSTLGADVRTLMIHYTQMLRRHIMSESEIADLCKRIYQKHQQALDLIYEYRPDRQSEIQGYLEDLIREKPTLVIDHSSKSYVRFALKEWDTPLLLEGSGWTRSGRILLFEFTNAAYSLKLRLYIGPGPEETRRRLFEIAQHNRQVFMPSLKTLYSKWTTIFLKPWLSAKSYEEKDKEELKEEIRKHWGKFLATDLPQIESTLKEQPWIWQSSHV